MRGATCVRFVRPCLELLEGRELLNAGALDPTFNPGGPIPGVELIPSALGYSIAIQSDGKILAGGDANPIFAYPGLAGGGGAFGGPSGEFIPGRYNVDGSPDLTFQAGLLPTVFALQSDGKIVTATQGLPNQGHILIQRFNADGTPDLSFGASGTVTLTLQFDLTFASSIAIQGDGKIVVLGSESGDVADASAPYGSDFVSGYYLARFNADGSADATFNPSGPHPGLVENVGVVQPGTNLGSPETVPYNLTVQPNGDILFAANLSNSGSAVIRCQSDGSLDAGFGQGGYAFMGQGSFNLESMVVQADGKIVVGGVIGGEAAGQPGDTLFTLKRLDADGGLDASFGDGGVVSTDLGTNWADVHSLAVQSDGKIIAVGTTQSDYGATSITVVCYEPNGGLDTNFGTGGEVLLSNLGGSVGDTGGGVALEPDGGIVVVGQGLSLRPGGLFWSHLWWSRRPHPGPPHSRPRPRRRVSSAAPGATGRRIAESTAPVQQRPRSHHRRRAAPPPTVVTVLPSAVLTTAAVVADPSPVVTDSGDGLLPGTALAVVQVGSNLLCAAGLGPGVPLFRARRRDRGPAKRQRSGEARSLGRRNLRPAADAGPTDSPLSPTGDRDERRADAVARAPSLR